MMIEKKYEQISFDFNLSNQLSFEEQQEMIENNTKLIYKVLHDLNYSERIDDLYDVGLLGLINAVRNFDKTKNNSVSHYLYVAIKYEIFRQLEHEKKDSLSKSVPISKIVANFSNEMEEDDGMFFPDSYDLEKDVLIKDVLDEIGDLLDYEKDLHREIFCKYYGIGCLQESPEDIVEEYGIPYSTIRVILYRVRKNLKKKVGEWNEK